MALTRPTYAVDNITSLSTTPNATEGLTGPQLQAKFDKSPVDGKAYLTGTLLPELDTALTIATQAEAEAGTNNTKLMTPLRAKQAIDTLTGFKFNNFISSDFNTLIVSGYYLYSGTGKTNPPPNFGVVLVFNVSSYITQICIGFASKICFRTSFDGGVSWVAWKTLTGV